MAKYMEQAVLYTFFVGIFHWHAISRLRHHVVTSLHTQVIKRLINGQKPSTGTYEQKVYKPITSELFAIMVFDRIIRIMILNAILWHDLYFECLPGSYIFSYSNSFQEERNKIYFGGNNQIILVEIEEN